MAASANLLADELVRITVEGMEKADQMTDALRDKFGKMGEAARKAEGFVKQIGTRIQSSMSAAGRAIAGVKERIDRLAASVGKVASSMKAFTLGGALGIGGILAGASSGTVEADRFGKAVEYLSRVLGNEFAPYMRMATQAIIEVANSFRSLTPETRASIAAWAIWGTTIAASITVLPMAIKGLASLAGGLSIVTAALGACLTPTAVAIAGFAALGAATVNAFQEMDNAESRWLKNHGQYMELAVKMSNAFFKTFGDDFAEYIRKSGVGLGLMTIAAGEKLGIFAPGTLKGAQMDESAFLRNRAKAKADAEAAQLAPIRKAMDEIDKIKARAEKGGSKGGVFGWLDGLGGAMDRIKNAAKGGGFGLKLDVRFESAQQTFDRLQVAFTEQSTSQEKIGEAQLNEAKKGNDLLQQGIMAVKKIADQGPVIR